MPTDGRLRILVSGFIGLLPAGGVTWDYIQYPLGLRALGHDVFYVEDTGIWPDYDDGGAARVVRQLGGLMTAFGLGERWAYRDAVENRWHGPLAHAIEDISRSADMLLNVSWSTSLRDEHMAIPARVLIDSDPMFTQIRFLNSCAGGGGAALAGHTHHFTFGESVGEPDCRIPDCGVAWAPTRQPVCLDRWRATPPPPDGAWLSTVMNWSAMRTLRYADEDWGQKDVELLKLIGLPQARPGANLALALAPTTEAEPAAALLRAHGWQVLDAQAHTGDWRAYRDFLAASRGEFSVAKETYVKGRTGWFSCRSACYLAAGRPVIAQDTGWSRHIPPGEGLFAFSDEDGALAAIDALLADPDRHARTARELAEAHFDSRRVLDDLLSGVGA